MTALRPDRSRRAGAARAALRGGELDDEAVVERCTRASSGATSPSRATASPGGSIATLGAEEALRRCVGGPDAAIAERGLTREELADGAEAVDAAARRATPCATRSRSPATHGRAAASRRPTPEWPAQLDDLDEHAPLCLWVRGDVAALVALRPSVALVGARAATSYGEHVAHRARPPSSPAAASRRLGRARTASTAPRTAPRSPSAG